MPNNSQVSSFALRNGILFVSMVQNTQMHVRPELWDTLHANTPMGHVRRQTIVIHVMTVFGFFRYQVSNTVDFQNRYCGGGDVNLDDPSDQQRSGSLTFQWSVPEANVQYTNGTSSISENPSIVFPGPGTYTVCEEVFYNGISVFECCHEVIIGGCFNPPVAFYTSEFALFNRFVLNAANDGNQVEWTFSDPNVSFFQGTPQSPQIVIEFAQGT